MTSDREARLEELFDAAVDLPPDRRTAFLNSHCADDPTLRREIASLLMHDVEQSDSFLDEPAAHLSETMGRFEPGTLVRGRYRIERLLGEGGMGLVYLAEQIEPVQRMVALKLVKLGMDTREVLARFDTERQALAILQHPNVATVLDAGVTDDGRPYFVMEFVDGTPITRYCDVRNLNLNERLELFIRVCDAIQLAHHNGIIHRDIKPSNVLVSEQNNTPVPKVIDFGIAKALRERLTERTLQTVQGQFIGTPQYMSPEQAGMASADVDTRADVYGLGVLLYELLSGSTPFEPTTYSNATIEELRRRILEDDPPRPSVRLARVGRETSVAVAGHRRTESGSLVRMLQGDLDWIVMRALEKNRDRRYESVAALVADLRRHQRHEPVTAGPPGVVYASRKFVRRHRALVIGATAVALVLVAGTVVSTLFALGQTRALNEAERQGRMATSMNSFLQDILNAPNPRQLDSPSVIPRDVTVREAIMAFAGTIDSRFDDDPLVAATAHHTVGETLKGLSEYDEAHHHLRRSLEIRREHLGVENMETLHSMHSLQALLMAVGRYAEAGVLAEQAYEIRRRLEPDDPDTVVAMIDLADVALDTGDWSRAAAMYQEALAVADEVGMTDQNRIAITNSLAVTYLREARYEEAEPLIREAIDRMTALAGEDHSDTLDFRDNLATLYRALKRYDESEALLRGIIADRRRTLGARHRSTINSMTTLGGVYRKLERFDEANALFEEVLPIAREEFGEEHPTTQVIIGNYAVLLRDQGRYDEANELLMAKLEFSKRALGGEHPNTLVTIGNLARLRLLQGRYEESESYAKRAYDGFNTQFGEEHPRTQVVMRILRDLYTTWDRPDEASDWHDRLEELGAATP